MADGFTFCGDVLNRWSNPDLKYDNKKTGDMDANNAITLNENAFIASNWRQSVMP